MAWLAVDKNGDEYIYINKPHKEEGVVVWIYIGNIYSLLPKGSIKKLIGRELTWENEPVEI